MHTLSVHRQSISRRIAWVAVVLLLLLAGAYVCSPHSAPRTSPVGMRAIRGCAPGAPDSAPPVLFLYLSGMHTNDSTGAGQADALATVLCGSGGAVKPRDGGQPILQLSAAEYLPPVAALLVDGLGVLRAWVNLQRGRCERIPGSAALAGQIRAHRAGGRHVLLIAYSRGNATAQGALCLMSRPGGGGTCGVGVVSMAPVDDAAWPSSVPRGAVISSRDNFRIPRGRSPHVEVASAGKTWRAHHAFETYMSTPKLRAALITELQRITPSVRTARCDAVSGQ